MILNSLQEFYSFFKNNRPLISIDYGNKKIGVAISTPDHIIAMPYTIIFADTEQKKLNKIIDIIVKHNICAIVVGFPIHMDGSHSSQTKIVIEFADKLAKKTNLPIYLQDERLTSKAADNLLRTMGFNRKQRNIRDDLLSASLILETTIESVKKL